MSVQQQYVDCEDVVCLWLKSLTITDSPKIFLSSDKITTPSIELLRVGGSPLESVGDEARISFNIWGSNRVQAKAITLALVNAIQDIRYQPPIQTARGTLCSAEVINWLWLPDTQSKTARYVLDARVVVTA